METIHTARYHRLLEAMKEQDIAGLALGMSSNQFYLTGYAPKVDERYQVLFISTTHEPVLIVPELYQEEAERNCWVEEQILIRDGESPIPLVRDLMDRMGMAGKRIAIDATLPFHHVLPIIRAAAADLLVPSDALLNNLRRIKDAHEIEILAESGRRCDEVMQLAIDFCQPGVTEEAIKDFVEQELRARDIRGRYSNLIASGPNSSLPHHTTGSRVIQEGDTVYFDIGGTYRNYWSDSTRTLHMGPPSEAFKTSYEAVRRAQQAAKDLIRPGVTSEQVYLAAYDELEKDGLGRYFLHRLGHGLGLDGHENISINRGDDTVLEEGMVFSVEPGVYFKGVFGIRIEDTVVVTKDGHRSFNHFTKDLLVK